MADIKDIKLGNTKYNIKIPSSRVKSMADYAKPSSKPSPEAIQQSDTLNAALGKLEYKADTNQTNIWYALNDGVKNLCPINSGSLSEAGYLNEDGTVGQVLINPIPSGSYKLVWTLSSTATECGFQIILAQGDASVSANRIKTETKYVSNTTGTFTADITVPSGKTVTNLVLYMNKAGSMSNVMICRADLYSQDSTYVPYALPNSDLTQLEAEDRAELIELVDSGAKNVYNPSRIDNVPTGLTVTRESDGTTLKINGTYSGTGFAYIDVGTFITDRTGVYYLNVITTKTMSEDFIIHTSDGHLAGSSSYNYTTNPYTSVVIKVASGQTFNNDTVKILICTKAAFGVSPKFVPYRIPIKGVYVQDIPIACSTTLTTTGIKFTATEKAAYRITATAIYYNSIPLKLVIKYKTNSSAKQLPFCTATHADGEDVSLIASGIISLDASGEFEVFAQYASQTSNYFYVLVEKIG